jgi:hypothetical protein
MLRQTTSAITKNRVVHKGEIIENLSPPTDLTTRPYTMYKVAAKRTGGSKRKIAWIIKKCHAPCRVVCESSSNVTNHFNCTQISVSVIGNLSRGGSLHVPPMNKGKQKHNLVRAIIQPCTVDTNRKRIAKVMAAGRLGMYFQR